MITNAMPANRSCAETRPLGRTGLAIPPVIFGTSCLGNLYEVVSDKQKTAIVEEILRCSPTPAVLDSAGKYGAGLSLEATGSALRSLGANPNRVLISNKLGWYRVPLRGKVPTFERGVWAGINHDAEPRISYDGILQCYEQGRELLGSDYRTQLVSVHDPDEYLVAAKTSVERQRRFDDILGAYRALFDLKRQGAVTAVGVGAKDWRVIREIADQVALDWVMFACSLTVYSHPRELLDLVGDLHLRGVAMINSAVFHSGFLTGGPWFDYRQPDPGKESGLFAWRELFLSICQSYGTKAADVCVQFGFALPGVVAVALNTGKPERIKENVGTAAKSIPPGLWRALKDAKLVAEYYPIGST